MSDVRCTFCEAFNPPGPRNCVSCGAELPGAAGLPVSGPIAGVPSVGRHGNVVSENELMAVVREHGKIAAIKRHREATGSGLKEAKDAVEAIMARTGTQASKSPAGCSTYVFVVIVAVIAVWRLSAGGF